MPLVTRKEVEHEEKQALHIRVMHDETVAKCCEDMVSSDGIILYSKDQGLEIVRLYDELLDTIMRRFGVDSKI